MNENSGLRNDTKNLNSNNKSLNVDSKAVSPLLGFVLLLMILMTFLGIMQSSFVPIWNKQAESRHLDTVSYQISKLSESVSLAASSGNPAKVVIEAGAKYPNYYVLVSPSKASGTLSKERLIITINGTLDNENVNGNFETDAIIFRPNYLYSSATQFVYEHSAVLMLQGLAVPVSSQSSFWEDRVVLYIINATFSSMATTESLDVILNPLSYGGFSRFSGSITFECYSEETAEWWNKKLSEIYGDKVTKNGRNITVQLSNVEFSIAYLIASTSATSYEFQPELRLKNVTETNLEVYEGSTVLLVAKLLDEYWNPVRNHAVNVQDPCNGNSQIFSDEDGFVRYHFNARGECVDQTNQINFLANNASLSFNVTVLSSPSQGWIIKTLILSPTDDAYVSEENETGNFGYEPSLIVDGQKNKRYRTFINFNLSEVIGKKILFAKLYLYASQTTGQKEIYHGIWQKEIYHGIYRVLNPWYEENITWNSHLNLNIATEPTYTAFISGKGWIWWDVTIDVQDIADGGANYGWCIKDADESGNEIFILIPNKYVEYNSREANKNNPYLEIIYID